MVAGAQRATTLDLLERAHHSGVFEKAILCTDSDFPTPGLGPWLQVEEVKGPFHFGESLRDLIRRYRLERPFYVGGGSLSLMPEEELAAIALKLASSHNTLITNNIYSSDFVAFTPGTAVEGVELPRADNPLASLLAQRAGLKAICLPRSAASLFDVDTPTDLMVLKLHPAAGPQTRAYLSGLDLDLRRLEQALGLLTDCNAEILVAGRVGSEVWAGLERDTDCRVRLLAEERGMRADGREERGEARSILGFYLERVGEEALFHVLAQLGDAAFIDSRVIFAHLGLRPSLPDRFYSDLGLPEKIRHPRIRRFTQAALEAPIPVVMGGHSLVAGGMLAITEVARQSKVRSFRNTLR
jgi:hypothetical protein